MLEARRTSSLSGTMPMRGTERISSTSLMFSISPRAARPASKRVIRRCLSTRPPFSAFSVLESSNPMMRSESRTEETSGLVTITAASACRMASVAPRSMPAGLSQITQSNFSRKASITRATPSSVSASLSRVCEAGRSHRFSTRLSRISACGSLATPCTTLIRSNTTRRSAPSMRSRLRRPTSKSTTTTLSPPCASAAPRAAVDVVLPTPPLPEVTTRTLAIPTTSSSIQSGYLHHVAFQPGLRRPAAERLVDLLGGGVETVDGKQLGFDPVAEDARAGVAAGARHGAAAQRSVDVDRTARHDLGAGAHGAQNGHVPLGEHDGLAGTNRILDQQRARRLRGRGHLGRRRNFQEGRGIGGAAATHHRRQLGPRDRGVDPLEAENADLALVQVGDEVGDGGGAELRTGKVEHHWAADEEAGRALEPGVEVGEPIEDRRLRREHERQVGVGVKTHRSAGLSSACHDGSRLSRG